LFIEVFGVKGNHARPAVGVGQLPLDMSVEIEMIVVVAD
jgi:enamine deaminase RidA (YjgF/YER057c/UK114 family)